VTDLPVSAAWRHVDVRDGFEVVFPSTEDGGLRFEGHSTGVEAGQAWAVRYSILLDGDWRTRHAHVVSRSAMGSRQLELERDGAEDWLVNGAPAPHLVGCLDVDLEASAFTNAFPVRRLGLAPGESAEAPAAYVRAPDLRVERLEQSYRRIEDDGARTRYDYASPQFEFEALLVYDEHGFVVEYPGIAERVA
jgi:uncharacterized protein